LKTTQMSVQTLPRQSLLPIAAAFGTGCLLTLMVHFNSELGRYGTPRPAAPGGSTLW
jgi:uncharacterized membrane protein YdcZ (DUF606 family)